MTRPGAHDPVGHAHVLHDGVRAVMCGRRAARRRRGRSYRRRGSGAWPRTSTPTGACPRWCSATPRLPDLRDGHPLNEVMPLLRSTLVSIADEAMHVMLVTDADGTILWREGAARLLHAADAVGLSPGIQRDRGRRSAPTRWAPRWPSTRRCRSTRPSTSSAPTTSGRAPRRPCTTPTPARSSARSTSAARSTPCTRPWSSSCRPPRSSPRTSCGCAWPSPTSGCACATCRTSTSLRGAGRRAASRRAGGSSRASRTGCGPNGSRCPTGGGRVTLADGREMEVEPLAEGYLLHAPATRDADAGTAARCRCGSRATPRRGPCWTAGPIPLTLRPAELLTALALHPDGLTAERLALRSTATTATPPPCAARCCGCAGSSAPTCCAPVPTGWTPMVDTDFDAARRALRAGRPPRPCARARGRCCPARTPRRSASCATSWPRACAAPCSTATTSSCSPRSPRTPWARTTWRCTTGWSRSCPRRTPAAPASRPG